MIIYVPIILPEVFLVSSVSEEFPLVYCNDQQKGQARSHLFRQNYYNPGQNVLGHLRKLDKKTHFAKLTHILPLKKALGCCYKGLFLLSPSPPSSVDCVELKLECITSTLHRGRRGEGRCLNLTSYCVSVPRVLTRVVEDNTSCSSLETFASISKLVWKKHWLVGFYRSFYLAFKWKFKMK